MYKRLALFLKRSLNRRERSANASGRPLVAPTDVPNRPTPIIPLCVILSGGRSPQSKFCGMRNEWSKTEEKRH